MKKILSVALLLSGITFAVFAQQSTPKVGKEGRKEGHKKEMTQKTPEEMAKFRTERLDKTVKLTEKQKKDVYALNLKNAQAKKQVMESGKGDRESMLKAKEASRAELNKILTPEQQKLMTDKMSQKDGKKFEKRDGGKKSKKGGDRSSRTKEKIQQSNN